MKYTFGTNLNFLDISTQIVLTENGNLFFINYIYGNCPYGYLVHKSNPKRVFDTNRYSYLNFFIGK
jgi:hypothetical protein